MILPSRRYILPLLLPFIALSLICPPTRSQSLGNIATVVGTGEALPPSDPVDSYVPATGARLLKPRGISVGARGGIFFADGNLIRKYNPTSGLLVTLAGTVSPGFAGDSGTADKAKFFDPSDVETDAAGNLYIADTGNYRIRKIAYDGTVSTIVGTGIKGTTGDDGPAAQALLSEPTGLALDSAGNLYIADGYRVREVDAATGKITTIAGAGVQTFQPFFKDAKALEAKIGHIKDIAVGPDGELYLAGSDFGQIFELIDKQVFWIAGAAESKLPGDGKDVTEANFGSPNGIVVNANGDLYIADPVQQRIRRIDHANSIVTTEAGSGGVGSDQGGFDGDDGPASLARLNSPWGLAIHPSGDLYISDTNNLRIRRVARSSSGALFNGAPFPTNGLEYSESTTLPRPGNDDIEAATLLEGFSGQIAGTNTGATVQAPFLTSSGSEPSHGYAPPQHSIWYKWSPTSEGRVTFDTTGSNFDTRLSLYEVRAGDSPDMLRRVASNDDAAPSVTTSRVTFYAQAESPSDYYLAVDGYNGVTGAVALRWNTDARFGATPRGPVIIGIEPAIFNGSPAATIRIKGENFFGTPSVRVNGSPRATTRVDETTLDVQVPNNEIPAMGTIWFGVGIGLDNVSNTYALDVIPYVTLNGAAGAVQSGSTRGTTAKLGPATEAFVQCPPDTACSAVPAVGSLGEARNLLPVPEKPSSDTLFMIGATGAQRVLANFNPGVEIPQGGRLIALKGNPTLPVTGGALPALGGGNLSPTPNPDPAPGGTEGEGGVNPVPAQGEAPRMWGLVKGSGGVEPVITSPTGGGGSAVEVTFDATSAPAVSELTGTVFALVTLIPGDVDLNNRVDVQDAVIALQSVVGMMALTDLQGENGDVSPAPGAGVKDGKAYGDGVVDVQDVVRILRTAVGLL